MSYEFFCPERRAVIFSQATMRFNDFIWRNYLETESGRRAVSFFERFGDLLGEERSEEIVEFVNRQYYEPWDREAIEVMCSWANGAVHPWALEREVCSPEDAQRLFTEIVTGDGIELQFEDGSTARVPRPPEELLDELDIHAISFGLFQAHPEHFFPYVFFCHFFRLAQICDAFGIALPKIPTKRDTRGRRLYYGELCRALHEYRHLRGWTPAELCAFLYDFAPHFLDDFLRSELPAPTRAYLVGAHKGTWEFVDGVMERSISNWQGNPETLPGDIVVMYALAPRSATHSVWRAISPGFVDPFFHWYDTTWIGRPVRLAGVPWATIKEDPILSEMPVVKQNMQGVNGRAMTAAQYDRLLELAGKAGADLSIVPRLVDLGEPVADDVRCERDVEEKLLEPLLARLGYAPKDWRRQVPLRIGRGERIYPDYVLFAETSKRGEESGDFIWEAKFRITGRRQLEEAFAQALSYARHLGARGLGLVALEGVWVAEEKRGLRFDALAHSTWRDLTGPDAFHELRIMAGKNKTGDHS